MSTLKIIQGRSNHDLVRGQRRNLARNVARFIFQAVIFQAESSLSTNTSSPWLPQNHFSAPLEHSPASPLPMSDTLPPRSPAKSQNPHQVRQLRRARLPTSVSERSLKTRRKHSVGISFLHVNKLIILTNHKSINL